MVLDCRVSHGIKVFNNEIINCLDGGRCHDFHGDVTVVDVMVVNVMVVNVMVVDVLIFRARATIPG